VKTALKSVNISRSYRQNYIGSFCMAHGVDYNASQNNSANNYQNWFMHLK